MIITISDKQTHHFEFCVEADRFEDYGDELEGHPDQNGISVIGSLRRKNAHLLAVDLHLSGTMIYPCARCLSPVPVGIELDYSDDYELQEGQDTVDLIPMVEECLFIHEPYRVLCDEECKGLCPGCGVNLNEEQCQCSQEAEIDPRLAALKSLL